MCDLIAEALQLPFKGQMHLAPNLGHTCSEMILRTSYSFPISNYPKMQEKSAEGIIDTRDNPRSLCSWCI